MEQLRTSSDASIRRGRPGRQSTKERTEGVPVLIAGKKSVDTLAKQFGVNAATIASWRQTALEGIESPLRRGSEPSQRERALEDRTLRSKKRSPTRVFN